MITINNKDEMERYYNKETNTYVFDDDVIFDIDINIAANIYAINLYAINIRAFNVSVKKIKAFDIKADIIDAVDVYAEDINACNIKARNIKFDAVCFAKETFVCNFIKGSRINSKYFCLDSKVQVLGNVEAIEETHKLLKELMQLKEDLKNKSI